MINTKSAAVTVSSVSSSNAQTAKNNVADISNTLDTPISALPTEMICHIGSFLDLKDKVRFNQALSDAGLSVFIDYDKILHEFNSQFLTQKINILLDNNRHNIDIAKFYTPESEEEPTDIYSFLFNQMCNDFKKKQYLSEQIATLVDTVDIKHINLDKIIAHVERDESNAEQTCDELIDHFFPHLTDLDVRNEIKHRVQVFDAKWTGFLDPTYAFLVARKAKSLLAFIKMEEKYRGMPVELVKRTQKLASSHLIPIIQKVNEKMQTMPTEELRALLLMAIDESQVEDFCDRMIALGAENNPFYLKGSPYFHALKSDLLYRANITKPLIHSLPPEFFNLQIFKHYVAYYADDAYLKQHASGLMNYFSAIQVSNGEDPKDKSKYGHAEWGLPYKTHIRNFYSQMEAEHAMTNALGDELRSRVSLLRASTPDHHASRNMANFILNAFARSSLHIADVINFLHENPNNINVQNLNGDTLLHLIIRRSFNREMLEILARELNISVDVGYMRNLEELIAQHANLNIKNSDGLSPLMLAAQLEDMWALNLLLKQPNLDVNQTDNDGNTALHYAVILNKKMAMHRLLRHEATDKNIENSNGKKPYDLAELAGLSSLFNSLSLV